MRFPGFIGPSYTLNSKSIDAQRCVNLYPQLIESGTGKEAEQYCLLGTPGLELVASVGEGPIKNIFSIPDTGYIFVVSGDRFYRILAGAWSVEEIGSFGFNGVLPIGIAYNGTHLLIVDGIYAYTYDVENDVFAYHPDSSPNEFFEEGTGDFPTTSIVTYQDGYFIIGENVSQNFYLSGLNSTDFDWTAVAQAEGSHDNNIKIVSYNRDLWIFGRDSIEIWNNTGNADFAFERNNNAFIEHGCIAQHSVAKINDEVFWLGKDRNGSSVVYRSRGFNPERVSTHAIENALKNFGKHSLRL